MSYAGTPGAAKLDLGEKPRNDVEVDNNDDDMSALSDLSRGDLLELLKELLHGRRSFQGTLLRNRMVTQLRFSDGVERSFY